MGALARAIGDPDGAELLDWLENSQGFALVSDDNIHWACVSAGMQAVPVSDGPQDITTIFFIEKEEWRSSVREAIEFAARPPEGEP
jgi:hypothetical protein